MKYYRYMSLKEFQKLSSGMMLVNNNRHGKSRTESFGFCFLPEKIPFYSYRNDKIFTYSPEECIDFLSGIVTNDVLVEFDVENPELLIESSGIYADPVGLYSDCICITEYCTRKYSRDTFVPLRYAIINNISDVHHTTWYAFN